MTVILIKLDHLALRQLANRVAEALVADLKAGKIPKIGIDEIMAACDAAAASEPDDWDRREQFLDLTTRRIIQSI
jgi:hypothetical protein